MKNEKLNSSEKIKVVVRCRPMNKIEAGEKARRCVDISEKNGEVRISKKNYTYDKVFGPNATQLAVYKEVVVPIVKEVLLGFSCTIFAYGQTGTGKTYTMEGERSSGTEFSWENDPHSGIIPRTMNHIFDELSSGGFSEYAVHVSLIEIYNEEIFDLLSVKQDIEKLKMYDDPDNKGAVKIKGVEEVAVSNKDEIYAIMERGSNKRKVASTLMNSHSSRSHCVFQIQMTMKFKEENDGIGEEYIRQGKLYLVDLAGSENVGRSGAQNQRAREAGNINQSLLALGRVITGLVERSPHIPYRESKLTRLLQDSLGGSTKTCIISTISPASTSQEETVSTLDYSSRAKKISNKPCINQVITKRALIEKYVLQIQSLKSDLAAAQLKNGVYLDPTDYERMKDELDALVEEKEKRMIKDAAIEEEMDKLKSEIDVQIDRNNELKLKNIGLKGDLHKSEYLKSKRYVSNTKQYARTKELCADLDANEGDIQSLQGALTKAKLVNETNIASVVQLRNGQNPVLQNMGKTITDSSLATSDILKSVESRVESVRSIERDVEVGLELHARLSKAAFSELDEGVRQLMESVKNGTCDRLAAAETNTDNLLKKLTDKFAQYKESHEKSMLNLRADTGKLIADVDRLTATVTGGLAKIEPCLKKALGAQEENERSIIAAKTEMMASLSQYQAIFTSNMEKCITSSAATRTEICSMASDISQATSCVESSVMESAVNMKSQLEQSAKTVDADKVEIDAFVDESKDIISAVSSGLSESMSKVSRDLNCLEKNLNGRVGTSTSALNGKVERLVTDQKKFHQLVDFELTQTLTENQKYSLEQTEHMEKMKTYTASTQQALDTLVLDKYNLTGETPAKRDRRSLQKPITIMNESQLLEEYEQPSFNTTADESDLRSELSDVVDQNDCDVEVGNAFEDSMAFECRSDATDPLFRGKPKQTKTKKRKMPNSPLSEPDGKRLSSDNKPKMRSRLPRPLEEKN